MKMLIKTLYCICITSIASFSFNIENKEVFLVYRGTSDASAAVAIGRNMFIVADDENNTLRVYKTTQGGSPLLLYDLTEFLDVESEHPEVDIEGATKIGQRIYWISSHGRNKEGKTRPNRYRFFATNIETHNSNIIIKPIGKPCKTLIHALVKSENMRFLRLDKATRFDSYKLSKKERQKLAPKRAGLNIEGLCASSDSKTIYIGLRNPSLIDRRNRRSKAIIIPLKNADAVLEQNQLPIFGEPILWDLTSFGIKSMEYSSFHKAYFIIAGASDDTPGFALFQWDGKINNQPVLVKQFEQRDFNPEALITFKNSEELFLLSDDGSLPIKVQGAWECLKGELRADGTCQNKHLINPEKKTFRGLWLVPETKS
jgi:hypothetical protein